MTPVRLGILGCGAVMEHYLAAAAPLLGAGRVRVVAACDRASAKESLMRDRHGVAVFSTDPAEIIERPDVDLVLVFTPVLTHAALTIAALGAGKHVLVEKTMAVSMDEGRQVLAAVRAGGGHLLVAPHVLLSPTYQTMWRRVHAGDVGQILSARGRYGWAAPFWQGGWVYQRGGGALFEFAVYNITSLTGFIGPVRRVSAVSRIALSERTIGQEVVRVEEEDNAHVLLDFGNGVLAVVTTSFTFARYRSPAVELYGSQGTIQMMGDDWAPAGHELWQNRAGCWQIFEETAPTWSWTDGLRHMVECVEQGRAPLVGPDHAFHVLEVLLAARQAAQSGQVQSLTSSFVAPQIPRVG